MSERRSVAALMVFIFVVMVLAGCGEKPVAIVNNTRITESEFISQLKEEYGKQILAQMISRQLIEDAFVKAGLEVSEEEVNEVLERDRVQSQFPTLQAYHDELARRGIDIGKVKESIRLGLMAEKLATKDITVTEEAVKKFFADNKQRYDKPLRVTIKEIVVISQAHADEVMKKLEEPGASFSALAVQHSISSATSQWGGQRAETAIERLVPMELQEPARTAQIGSVVGPMQTDQGWYIIQIDDRKAAEKATLEKAREQVEREYRGSQAPRVEQLLNQLREAAIVKIVSQEFQDLAKLYQGPQSLPTFGDEAREPAVPAPPPPPAQPAPTTEGE